MNVNFYYISITSKIKLIMDWLEPKLKELIINEYYIILLILSIIFLFHTGLPFIFEFILSGKISDSKKENQKK